MRVTDFGFQPGPAGRSGPRPEAVQGSKELIFNLGAGCREIHQASARVIVQRPESSDRKDRGSLPCQAGASGRGLLTGLVMKENLTLPIVGLNPENRIGKEQDWDGAAAVKHSGPQITLWVSS